MVAEKSLTEKNVHMYYIREKEGKNENLKKEGKMRNSILISIYTVFDKQYVAVLLLHNTINHYQALCQISES